MKQLSQKLVFLTLLMLFASNSLFAQLTGTKTIGTLGTYTSLELAVADLNTFGVGAGGVIFEFIPNSGANYTEAPVGNVIITTTTGTLTNTILFRPSATVGTVSINASLGFGLVVLDAADYVTFDGRVASTGAAKKITLTNTNVNGSSVLFRNGASNNKFVNVNMKSRNTATGSGVVSFTTSATGANTDNLLDNCELSGDAGGNPTNVIYSVGSVAPNNNTNNTVRNCLIYDYFQAGICTVLYFTIVFC